MELIWEMKRKRIWHLLKGPLIVFLVAIITLFTTWTLHVLYAVYTDTQAHMSIYEWTAHLYAKFL